MAIDSSVQNAIVSDPFGSPLLVIRASLGNRTKEGLLVDFINQTDLDQIGDKASVIDAFFIFAQAEQL